MQKNFRADTDTDTIFVIFTDTVSVDGYLYPSDPGCIRDVQSKSVGPLTGDSCLTSVFFL